MDYPDQAIADEANLLKLITMWGNISTQKSITSMFGEISRRKYNKIPGELILSRNIWRGCDVSRKSII